MKSPPVAAKRLSQPFGLTTERDRPLRMQKNGAFRVRRRRFSIKGRCGSGRGGPAAVPEVKQQDGADERNDGGRNREDPVAARQARDHVAQAGGERHREAVGAA